MNFASKAAFLQSSDDDGEEVYEEDLNADIPESLDAMFPPSNPVPLQPPMMSPNRAGPFGALPKIVESNEDLMRSSLFQPAPAKEAKEEVKLQGFSSLAPGSSFTAAISGKSVNLVKDASKASPIPPKPFPPSSRFSSLFAGSSFSSSLQGKSINLIKDTPPQTGAPLKFGPPPPPRMSPSSAGPHPGSYPAPPFKPGFQPGPPGFHPGPLGFHPGPPGFHPGPPLSAAANPFNPPPSAPPPFEPFQASPASLPPFPGFPSACARPAFPVQPKFGSVPQHPMPAGPPQAFVPPARRRAPGQGQVFKQQVDSNVVDIPLNVLKEETPIATGDPQFCGHCRSLLNSTSTVTLLEPGVYRWLCEFCGQENHIPIEAEEVPKENKVTYVLESAVEAAQARMGPLAGTTVIYVLDTSGSMCVTMPAPGKFALKTNRTVKEFEGILMRDDGDQFFPGQDRNTTYISRLECVQAAIESQISEILISSPTFHVGLLTFDEEVRIIGDGLHEVVVSGDRLNSWEECLREVSGKYQYFMGRNIAETKEALVGKVMGMQEKGATALGPATLMAVALAKEGGPGSKVILCTDGIANVGLGSLDSEQADSLSFYQQVAHIAKEGSVTVSVVSIEGEECKLNALLPLAVNTGGEVNKVNPLKLKDDFANILATKTVATDVEITVNLHKALKFRSVDPQYVQQNGSRLVRKLGTVSENETFIFEYCTKSKKELEESHTDISGLRQVPFQVLVQYQRSDGMKCVFADTEVQQVTSDREAALQQAEFDILARNAQMLSSNLVMEGRYQEAQVNSRAWGQAMSRNQQSGGQAASVLSYFQGSAPLYNQVNQEMRVQPSSVQPQDHIRSVQSDSMALAAHKQQKIARKRN